MPAGGTVVGPGDSITEVPMRFRSLVTLVLVAGCVFVFAANSEAAPPFHFKDTNSEFVPQFTTCDGQDISLFTTGTTSGTTFFDANGDVARTIVHNRFLDHFTNTVTGETLLNRGTFQETFIPVDGTDEFTDTVDGHVFLALSRAAGSSSMTRAESSSVPTRTSSSRRAITQNSSTGSSKSSSAPP